MKMCLFCFKPGDMGRQGPPQAFKPGVEENNRISEADFAWILSVKGFRYVPYERLWSRQVQFSESKASLPQGT